MVYDDAGISLRMQSGLNDDVAARGVAHRHSHEPAVVHEGIMKDGCTQDMIWFRSQHDPLIRCPCEQQGHRQGANSGCSSMSLEVRFVDTPIP